MGYNYDLLGRMRCEQTAAPTINATGACTAGSPLVQDTYDTTKLGTQGSTDFSIGQLTQSVGTTYYPDGTSATTTEQFQYDQRGRTITAQMQLGLPTSWGVTTALPTYQLLQAYNDADQPTTTSTSAGGAGYTFTNVYDPTTGTLTGLSNNSSSTANLATLAYNVNGLLSQLNFQTSTGGNGLATEQFSYDADLRPEQTSAIWASGSGQSGSLFNQTRSYDNVGNVTSLTTTQAQVEGQSLTGGTETENYCYDDQEQLIWAGNSGSQPGAGNGTCGAGTLGNTLSGAGYSSGYVYTNLGQLWQGPTPTGQLVQYLYCNSAPHELTGIYPLGTTCANQSSATAVYSASYDSWGNETSRTYNGVTATMAYDALNQMVQWTGNSSLGIQEQYVYDSSGERVLTRSSNAGTTNLTIYAFGLETMQYQADGTNLGNTYYYSLGGLLIGKFDGTNTSFFITDGLGSVVTAFSDTAGSAAVLGNQNYKPYGQSQYQQGSVGTSKGYTGQESDNLSGLDYYSARYYDPIAGIFLSPDNVQGNAEGDDPYSYVAGNPETLTDPTGHMVAPDDIVEREAQGTDGPGFPLPDFGQLFAGIVSLFATDAATITVAANTHGSPKLGPYAVCDGGHSYCSQMGVGSSSTGSNTSGGSWVDPSPTATPVNSGILNRWRMHQQQNPPITTTPPPGSVIDYINTDDFGGCSFTPTTSVATPKGEKPIGDLKVGDKVMAYNPKTNKMEVEPVLHVWTHTDSDLIDLTLTSGTQTVKNGKSTTQTSEVVHTTSEHPFLTAEKGFVPAGELKVGMHILRADGSYGVVTSRTQVFGTEVMYNLEVQKDHTFAVGDGEWVVHNKCSSPTLGKNMVATGLTWTSGNGQNPHHVIPCALANHPLVKLAGFDLNDASNGRFLWDYNHRGQALGAMEPYHANAPSYFRLARSLLDDAYQGLPQLTRPDAQNAISTVLAQLNGAINFQGVLGGLQGSACPLPGI